jgi:transposase
MMSLWDALRMNMMISYQELVRTFPNTNANFEMTGILLGQEVRKRKTPQEKIAIIQQTMEPGMNVSHVARLHGIQPSLLFKWKKQYQEGSLTAVAAGGKSFLLLSLLLL